MIARVLGFCFLALAVVAFGRDVWASASEGRLVVTTLGETWFSIHRDSLGLLQAGVQRRVWPPLWDPVITSILLRPAWALPAVLAALFFAPSFVRRWRG